jgi:23S rRNA pseudouridine1911/1915/1917 synthase
VVIVVVPASHEGERLDRALSTLIPDVSRAEVARWIEAGRVSVEGRVATRASERVRPGQRIEAVPLPPPPSDATPDPSVRFTVLYEDDAIVVVDKPAGLVVHPAKGHWEGTLVHGLLARGPLAEAEDEAEGPPRPGIVHRIDKDTSGVLVVARTAVVREALKKLFAAHELERVYDAIAVGTLPDRKTFDTLHGRHPTDRKKFTSRTREGKRAVTHVQVVERFEHAVRVECRLETGRTHQIRVHLAEANAPLLGDQLYGKPPRDPRVRAIGEELGRQALHARVLGFVHPITKKKMRFEAPWPEDFAAAVSALRDSRLVVVRR